MAMALRWHVPNSSFLCGSNGCRIVLFFIANRGAHVYASDWTAVRLFRAYEQKHWRNSLLDVAEQIFFFCINAFAYVHHSNGMACVANLLLWLFAVVLKVAANDLLSIEIVMLMIYGKYSNRRPGIYITVFIWR